MEEIKKLVKEKLCKKGEAYRKRRMAAGEKSSAYLSGRAVKVCNGTMSGKKKKTNEAEFSKGEKDKVKDMIKSLKKSSKGHAGQAKYLTKLVKEQEDEGNKVPEAALILPRGKKIILQAEEQDYQRGLIVELTNEGGYKINYWYGDDVKIYPAEVEVDGVSIKDDANEVYIKFHPELEENVAPNHDGKSAPYGSGYKELNVDKMAESLRDWFKKEDWVRINTSGNISGDCGTMKKDKATTRCLPKKKAQSLTKAERKATVAKKVRGSKKGKQFVSVKEAMVDYDFSKEELIRVIKQLKRGASTEIEMIKAFEKTLGRELTDDEIRGFKLNESTHPYENKGNIRTFSKDVDPTSLVWHSDKEDRLIEVLEGEGWKLQLDNKLPLLLSKGDRIFINEGDVHRVLKGTTDLKIKING